MKTRELMRTSHGTRAEAFGPREWGLLALIASMWGSSFLWIAIGLEAFEPGVVALLRIAFGAIAVSLIPGARRKIDPEDRARVYLLGVIWMAIPLTLFPIAQQWINSSRAGMINGAMPLFAGLFAAVLLRSMPRPRQIVGLVTGFAGVVLVSMPAAGGGESSALGIGLLLFATVLYGLSVNLTVPLQQKYGALPIVWRAQLTAVLLLIPYGLIGMPDSTFKLSSLLAVMVLGVLSSGMAFLLMATLVGRAGAARGAVAIYFVPMVAILLGVLVRDETIGAMGIIGMALIIAGAWLTSRKERRREQEPDPVAAAA